MKINILFIAIFLIILFSCDKLGAGSNLNAERYEIDASFDELLNAVNQFKINNPELCPPINEDVWSDPFYYIIFYYPEKIYLFLPL